MRVLLLASLLSAALALAGPVRGAVVARVADDGALALAADGSPRVAYVAGRDLFLAAPRASGAWTSARIGRLPAGDARIAGLEVDARGRAFALVEDEAGRWLVLAHRVSARWRLRAVPGRVPTGAVLGPAGLALDRAGRPAVAYAFRLPDRQTFLRLVTGGSFRTIGITRAGFPASDVPPAAAPVRMPDGTLRVLETFAVRGAGAFLWRRTPDDWAGRMLLSSVRGAVPLGPALARSGPTGFAAAWTLRGPDPGELQLRFTPTSELPQTEVLHRRALVEALTLAPEGAELAATEPVGDRFAGLILRPDGSSVEVDGRPLGLEAGAGGTRDLLVASAGALSWYRSPGAPSVSVSLTAARAPDGSVALSGRVAGATGGGVDLYRERAGAARELAGTALLGPDGSFSLVDGPPAAPLLYRAVYRDPLSGIPYASLLRRVVQ